MRNLISGDEQAIRGEELLQRLANADETDRNSFAHLVGIVANNGPLTRGNVIELDRVMHTLGKSPAEVRSEVDAIRGTFPGPTVTYLLPDPEDIRRRYELRKRDVRNGRTTFEVIEKGVADATADYDRDLAALEKMATLCRGKKGVSVLKIAENMQAVELGGMELRYHDFQPAPTQSPEEFSMLRGIVVRLVAQRDGVK